MCVDHCFCIVYGVSSLSGIGPIQRFLGLLKSEGVSHCDSCEADRILFKVQRV